jgi:hypothetical protein
MNWSGPMASTMSRWATICVLAFCVSVSVTHAAEPLALEAKIALGNVAGRIDHLAIDLPRQRLFVAELGNNSVGIVDLKQRKLVRTISGQKQPQGVGYHQPTDTLYLLDEWRADANSPDRLQAPPDQASAVSTRPFVSGSSSAATIRMP